jgi:hypothetical protein
MAVAFPGIIGIYNTIMFMMLIGLFCGQRKLWMPAFAGMTGCWNANGPVNKSFLRAFLQKSAACFPALRAAGFAG